MRTDIITHADALARLEPTWWALLARSPAATPFSAPAWLLPWWDSFAPGRLLTVAVWQGERLVALAPLYIEGGPSRRLLPLGIGVSDCMDILLDPSCPDAAGALTATLADTAHDWDIWSAEEAREGAAVLGLAVPASWTSAIEPQSACPVLSLGSEDLASIPAGQRRKLHQARNRTARRAWSLAASTEGTLAEDLDNLFRLHGARWESRGEAGVLAGETVRRFHRAATPKLLAAGLLRLDVLRIDEAVAGVYYGLHYGSAAYAYLGGFDPTFAFESPGTVLIGAAIEAAAAEGATEFHFLRGQEGYKYRWGARDRWNNSRTIVPR